MIQNMLTKLFGNRNQRVLKKMYRTVDIINKMEADIQQLSDEALKDKTHQFRKQLADGETLDKILPEAFAVVREASVRTLGLRHFDVQLIGGMVLNSGQIAEMKTGEGKTLVATLPAYLNAVSGTPVHVITVNDYLARRDSEWMGKLYNFLGLSVGVVVSGQDRQAKQEAYQADIVYGTNNEFGFDYLRDNMAFDKDGRAQRGLGFAVIDEVDSILIDEARTPLVISGPAEGNTEMYLHINRLAPKLEGVIQSTEKKPFEEAPEEVGDFIIDEKSKQVHLTEQGHDKAEQLLTEAGLLEEGTLYDVSNIGLMHHLIAALRAHNLYQQDVDYLVKDGQVVIVDEFTGRMMTGRRWSDGLHQAVEAKEGLEIQRENQTLASITFQNYFRLYDKLSGMTGTADTEAPEFLQIYGLEVVIIPTNRNNSRVDEGDLVYGTVADKFNAIVKDIEEKRANNQPVLVGTASIESSELLSKLLKQHKIPHQTLNAKHHEKEAQIIAEAGRPGTVTIATNMAGRGTDIVLGGNLESELQGVESEAKREEIKAAWKKRHETVLSAGGLHVLGTERNESRRVDNQLRGRCGRQGDPGSSRFFLSLEDNLMRIFGSDRIYGMMQKMGVEGDEAIEHRWISKAIENAQKKVEGHNFDIRKQLLEYDDVANEQRKVIYTQRNELMDSEDVSEYIQEITDEVLDSHIDAYVPPQSMIEMWNVEGLEESLRTEFGADLPVAKWLEEDTSLYDETLKARIKDTIKEEIASKEERVGAASMRHFEKGILLQVLDEKWKEHLSNMDYLRQGIGLRGYAQKNPKQEYKRESFTMFTHLIDEIKHDVVSYIARVRVPTEEEIAEHEARRRAELAEQQRQASFQHSEQVAQADTAGQNNASGQSGAEDRGTYTRVGEKVGRNQPCPCGSGKKYKQCHGKLV